LNSITQLFAGLPDRGLPARHVTEYMKFAQHESFFHLAAAKEARIAQLKANFAKNGLPKVYLSANLSGFECDIEGVDIAILDKKFFEELGPSDRQAKKAMLDGCVVIINNNDVASTEARTAYAEFFAECASTFFITWDWDNHHWLELSTFLAAHSDIYAPAHHENLYLLSRYNWLTAGPVYCSSVQWPRRFLLDHLPEMLAAKRADTPLGMHIPYAPFSFRMQVITTLNQHYPTIGFSSRAFHGRTLEDRLKEWYSHKTHWIAPVLNDVPIRIFDALITGGIPIVPASLRFLPPVKDIPREYIAFYSPADIVNPKALVKRALDLFDKGGNAGMTARHRFAVEKHHGDTSVHQMLNFAAEALELDAAC